MCLVGIATNGSNFCSTFVIRNPKAIEYDRQKINAIN